MDGQTAGHGGWKAGRWLPVTLHNMVQEAPCFCHLLLLFLFMKCHLVCFFKENIAISCTYQINLKAPCSNSSVYLLLMSKSEFVKILYTNQKRIFVEL